MPRTREVSAKIARGKALSGETSAAKNIQKSRKKAETIGTHSSLVVITAIGEGWYDFFLHTGSVSRVLVFKRELTHDSSGSVEGV
jgi:hypothetical protein